VQEVRGSIPRTDLVVERFYYPQLPTTKISLLSERKTEFYYLLVTRTKLSLASIVNHHGYCNSFPSDDGISIRILPWKLHLNIYTFKYIYQKLLAVVAIVAIATANAVSPNINRFFICLPIHTIMLLLRKYQTHKTRLELSKYNLGKSFCHVRNVSQNNGTQVHLIAY
jgi:hypothetical protein